MATAEVFAEIESPEFDAYMHLASTREVLFRLLQNSSAYRALLKSMRNRGNGLQLVLGRLQTLALAQYDQRYANPYDAAMSAYLWAIHTLNPKLGRIAAEIALQAGQTQWARRLASIVLEEPPTSSHTHVASKPELINYLKLPNFSHIPSEQFRQHEMASTFFARLAILPSASVAGTVGQSGLDERVYPVLVEWPRQLSLTTIAVRYSSNAWNTKEYRAAVREA